VPRLAIEAIQLDQIREHGGLPGFRDEDLLEASLARPRHKWAYEEGADLASLAAAYAFAILRNHPFRDGNKRTAFLALVVFLGLNGFDFETDEEDVVATIRAAAAGETSEEELTLWIRQRSRARR
jgi:death-on-curing protein